MIFQQRFQQWEAQIEGEPFGVRNEDFFLRKKLYRKKKVLQQNIIKC